MCRSASCSHLPISLAISGAWRLPCPAAMISHDVMSYPRRRALTSSQQDDQQRVQRLGQQQQTREFIDSTLAQMFAPQDEALQAAMDAPRANGMPEIAISPL